ncbi:MAG: hypothetical protein HC895_21285 [Leptolyngbyaceae cyanobacterium SM1_3_5]|nr:hypothetical protein [Leptolyngbyaceae cyanobacterium SM1_3_5]
MIDSTFWVGSMAICCFHLSPANTLSSLARSNRLIVPVRSHYRRLNLIVVVA